LRSPDFGIVAGLAVFVLLCASLPYMSIECRDIPHTLQMIKLFMEDDTYIIDMCKNIKKNKQMGIYNGAYEAVKLAVNMKKSDI